MSVLVKLTDTLPAGANVVAFWPAATILPAREVLEKAAADMGEPFTMSYLEEQHQGVTLSRDMTGLEMATRFSVAAAGNAPALVAADPDSGGAIDTEQKAAEFREAMSGMADALSGAATFGAGLPRMLLIGGLVLGGVLIVGYGVYRLARMKK